MDEKIIIGDDIVIEVVSVRGKTVRLGITAPEDVNIVREEIVPSPTTTAKLPKFLHTPDH